MPASLLPSNEGFCLSVISESSTHNDDGSHQPTSKTTPLRTIEATITECSRAMRAIA